MDGFWRKEVGVLFPLRGWRLVDSNMASRGFYFSVLQLQSQLGDNVLNLNIY